MQRSVSRACVDTLILQTRHNNGKADTLSCSAVRLEARPCRLSVGYVRHCDPSGWELGCEPEWESDREASVELVEFCLQKKSPSCNKCALLEKCSSMVFYSLSTRWEILGVSWLTPEIRPLAAANEESPEDTETQQTLLPDLCEVCLGCGGEAFMQPWCWLHVGLLGAALHKELTLGSLVMCATSKRIRLYPATLTSLPSPGPPLPVSGPHCGLRGERVEVMRL